MAVCKKSACAKDASAPRLGAPEFKERFEPIITKPECLAYGLTGGRQGHLAIASKAWVKGSADGAALRSITQADAKLGFLAVHATRSATAEGAEKWGLPDHQAESWATQMAGRLTHPSSTLHTSLETIPSASLAECLFGRHRIVGQIRR